MTRVPPAGGQRPADKAVEVLRRCVRPGDGVVWGQAAGEPTTLTTALAELCRTAGPVDGFCGLLRPGHPGFPAETVRLRSYGAFGADSAIDVVPCHLSAVPQLLRMGLLPRDVALVQVAPADRDGYHSLGVSVDYLPAALECARLVIAEVNDRMPPSCGPVRIHRSRFAGVVNVDRELPQAPVAAPSAAEARIAAQVAGLIPDGATVQLGIGRAPAAIAAALASHRGLGIHSGLLGDWVVDLMESGAVNNRGKGADAGVTVGGTALGTERLYRFLDRNPSVELRPVEQTHDVRVLARLSRFTAINAAVEVDLTGQVNAEMVGGRPVGAVGGQVDFMRGAVLSPGGRSIIVLPSTAHGGAVSRVVPRLTDPVTTARSDVDVVVTEHGVAELRGKGLAARRHALLRVADPAWRHCLAAASGSV